MTKKVKKTIIMPAEIAEKWLAALRSGEYKQGIGSLYNEVSDTYCCLGVLQKCITGEVELEPLPTTSWLLANKIEIIGNDCTDRNPILDPPVLYKDQNKLPGINSICVADLNDNAGYDFKEIADILDTRIKRI